MAVVSCCVTTLDEVPVQGMQVSLTCLDNLTYRLDAFTDYNGRISEWFPVNSVNGEACPTDGSCWRLHFEPPTPFPFIRTYFQIHYGSHHDIHLIIDNSCYSVVNNVTSIMDHNMVHTYPEITTQIRPPSPFPYTPVLSALRSEVTETAQMTLQYAQDGEPISPTPQIQEHREHRSITPQRPNSTVDGRTSKKRSATEEDYHLPVAKRHMTEAPAVRRSRRLQKKAECGTAD